jgi:hypothetical protein
MGLAELEGGGVAGAVGELDVEMLAGAGPGLEGIPHVVVGAAAAVVGQPAAACGVGQRAGVDRGSGGAADLGGGRVAGGEDVQALAAAELNLIGMACPAWTWFRVGGLSTGTW